TTDVKPSGVGDPSYKAACSQREQARGLPMLVHAPGRRCRWRAEGSRHRLLRLLLRRLQVTQVIRLAAQHQRGLVAERTAVALQRPEEREELGIRAKGLVIN